MSKYLLLVILNMPFVLFGYFKAIGMYMEKAMSANAFVLRIFFWSVILCGLIFAKPGYEYLESHHLTDSTPLSIPDVFLITGVMFCLFLCVRLYSKVDNLEKRVNDLHEKLSIANSKKS